MTSEADTICFIVHQCHSDFQSELLYAIGEVCQQRGLMFQCYLAHDGEKIRQAIERLRLPAARQRFVILGEPGGSMDSLHEILIERGYPCVLIDTLIADFKGSFVGTDNVRVARMGMEHLTALGHRRVTLLVNEPATIDSVNQKINAFEAVCREQGLTDCRTVLCGTQPGQNSFDAAYRTMDEVWNAEPPPSAIFTVSDPGAWAVLKWCSERRIAVPDRLSVLGFEGVRRSRFTHPALTSVAHPIPDLARRAIELLWEPIGRQEYLMPHLVLGESTGQMAE